MPEPLRVLLLVQRLDSGGTERQMTEVAKALDRSRFAVSVACFYAEGVRVPELQAAGVPIYEFPVRSFYAPATLGVARRFTGFLREKQFAVVHPFDVPSVIFSVPLARLARVSVVLSSQRGSRDLFPKVYQRGVRVTDRMVDGVVVNCESLRQELHAQDRVPLERMHVCYNGLDTERFSPGDWAESGEVVIGTVSVLRPEKRIDTLLRAFAAVRRTGMRLLIVGSGPEERGLKALAAELGLESACEFVPAAADVVSWYRKIDVFVLPSSSEAFSNSLLEAMACGCCVVASRVGGTVELVEDGECGVLFPAGDVDVLAARLKELAGDAGWRRSLALAARERVVERFTIQKSVQCFERLYEVAVAKTAKKRT